VNTFPVQIVCSLHLDFPHSPCHRAVAALFYAVALVVGFSLFLPALARLFWRFVRDLRFGKEAFLHDSFDGSVLLSWLGFAVAPFHVHHFSLLVDARDILSSSGLGLSAGPHMKSLPTPTFRGERLSKIM